jgi:hypothetical protein
MVKIANRTREIRPSGMKRGACGNVSYSGLFFTYSCARRISIPTDSDLGFCVERGNSSCDVKRKLYK